MNFDLSEEQTEMQTMVRRFAREELAPKARELDETGRFPEESFRKMGELGLLGLLVPEEYGGVGASVLTMCIVMEEIAYACSSTALSFLAHATLCCHNLACNGSHDQKNKYLPDLASGAKLGGLAMTEPGAGSDALGMQTVAVRHGDEYILNGIKTFITNAPVADVLLVYARTDKDAGPRGLSQFIVEMDFPGVSAGKPFKKMGMRGSPTSEVFFQDCHVPAANLVKGENHALGIVLGGLDIERTVGSSMGVGGGCAALDRALAYAKERTQFGQPIILFEMVAEKLANMAMEIEAARLLTYKAAVLCDEGVRCSAEASYAKLFSTEMCQRTCDNALQILGGYGYMQEYEVERMLRDARLGTIGAGTSEIQRLIIAKELVRRSM